MSGCAKVARTASFLLLLLSRSVYVSNANGTFFSVLWPRTAIVWVLRIMSFVVQQYFGGALWVGGSVGGLVDDSWVGMWYVGESVGSYVDECFPRVCRRRRSGSFCFPCRGPARRRGRTRLLRGGRRVVLPHGRKEVHAAVCVVGGVLTGLTQLASTALQINHSLAADNG